MTDYIKCSLCGKIIEKEKARKVTIYEKVKMIRKEDLNYVGHTKLESCLVCLEKIGYSGVKKNEL